MKYWRSTCTNLADSRRQLRRGIQGRIAIRFSLLGACLLSTMARFVPFLSLFLSLTVVLLTHASTLSPQATYWNSILPNTPMPSAIADLLSSDEKYGTHVSVGKGGVRVVAGKGKPGGTSVDVGKGGVHVVAGKGKPGGTSVGVGKGGVHVVAGKGKPGGGTTVDVGGKGGVHVSAGKGKPGGGTAVNVGHGGVNVNTGRKGKPPVIVRVGPGHVDPFIYRYAATETQIHDDPRVTLFFLEHDLHPGAKMTLQFTKTTAAGAGFLSRQEANSIPFKSTELPEILRHFSIQLNSAEAETIKKTIRGCEEPAAAGEEKYCATSLESMVDFSVKSLGTNDINAISTSVSKEDVAPQQYTVLPNGLQKMTGDKHVACHAEAYLYAVFYCHATSSKIKAYAVKMEGEDGQVDAVAVCHYDTKAWNPNHVAFKLLKVKPGSVPVCHFLPQDHIVWSRKTM